MKRSKIFNLIFLIILLALLLPISARADAAPPDVPDGENLNPGENSTMVQMIAEEVIIDVGLSTEIIFSYDDINYIEGYVVAYNCTFWLVNQGAETENLSVRFPINNHNEHGKVNILSIKVDDNPVPWVEDDADYWDDDYFSWAHFDVVFPPGEEVEVKVTYTTVTRGWPGNPHHRVSYILETGEGWYGPIEKGKIILRFPYKATSANVILAYTETPEGTYTDSDVYWEFTDLEPTRADNWKVQIVAPDLWVEILAERNRLEDSPNNISALYRLANFIYEATIYKGDEIYSTTLYEEGLEAIKKAVNLNPNDVESHKLYTLYLRAYCTEENALLMLEEIDTILKLDPQYYSSQEALWCLGIFSTATPPPRPIPTESTKMNTPTPTREPVQDSSPTINPNQLDTPIVEEEIPTSTTDKVINWGLITLLVILLLLGGTAVTKLVNKK